MKAAKQPWELWGCLMLSDPGVTVTALSPHTSSHHFSLGTEQLTHSRVVRFLPRHCGLVDPL